MIGGKGRGKGGGKGGGKMEVWESDFVMTMETASFRTLSPKTSMLSVGLTSSAWNIASVATGSTADIRAPNVKLPERERERERERLRSQILMGELYL